MRLKTKTQIKMGRTDLCCNPVAAACPTTSTGVVEEYEGTSHLVGGLSPTQTPHPWERTAQNFGSWSMAVAVAALTMSQ